MNELTRKWADCELDDGSYYVRTKTGEILLEQTDIDATFYKGFRCDVDEVIEKAPSYEELQELKEYEKTIKSYNGMPIDYTIACETVNKLLDEKDNLKQKVYILTESKMKLENSVGEIGAENAILKVLLKECQVILQETQKSRGVYFNNLHISDTLTKINEVLE